MAREMTRALMAAILALTSACDPIKFSASAPRLRAPPAGERRRPTEPEKRAAKLAEPNAKNCGFVALNEDPWSTINCTVGHFKRRRPFYAVFQHQGIDSFVAQGIVGGTDGTVRLMVYDSMGNRSSIRPCIHPAFGSILGRESIKCDGDRYLHHNAWTHPATDTDGPRQ